MYVDVVIMHATNWKLVSEKISIRYLQGQIVELTSSTFKIRRFTLPCIWNHVSQECRV